MTSCPTSAAGEELADSVLRLIRQYPPSGGAREHLSKRVKMQNMDVLK